MTRRPARKKATPRRGGTGGRGTSGGGKAPPARPSDAGTTAQAIAEATEEIAPTAAAVPRTILVVDVGGTAVKLRASDWPTQERIPSGMTMGPRAMVAAVREAIAGRRYDAVSLGYPGAVQDGRPAADPVNLAPGWVGYDFGGAFGAPLRVINDAAMQALGNYRGGRMLFLGFGTGLGTALVADGVVMPLELAHLPYRKERTFEEYVGNAARKRMGTARWQQHCLRVIQMLREAMQVSEVVLGGGNAKRFEEIPAGTRRGATDAAFTGGLMLWMPPATAGMTDAAWQGAGGR